MRKNQGLGDLDTPEEGHIGFGKNQTKTWKGKKCCCFWTGIQVQERKVIGRRLWNNARHGHSLNLLRASASLFFPRKKKSFVPLKGVRRSQRNHIIIALFTCVCVAPVHPFRGGSRPRQSQEMSLHDDTHGAVSQVFSSRSFWFWPFWL
jgi:hypothetical protein